MINNEEHCLHGNEAVYPAEMPKGQYFGNLPQNILELQADLWTKVKSGRLSTSSAADEKKIYIEFAAVLGIAVLCVAAKLIYDGKKKKFEDLSDVYGKNDYRS